MNAPVIFEEMACLNGKKIGLATLNAPNKLNALGLPMIELLIPQLESWQANPDIAIVILQGAGDKAFCAGGDIVNLYGEMVENPGQYSDNVQAFFTQEYQLDYLIHTLNKPVMVWGSGIVMGGGLGLMVGASHRVVTESTRMAMPEIAIGLYPDVGATWFLSHMPEKLGLFLGLTGAQLNAADAKYLELGNYFIRDEHQVNLFDALLSVGWGDTIALNHEKLATLLHEFELHSNFKMPESKIRQHGQLLNDLMAHEDPTDIVKAIKSLPSDCEWLLRAKQSLTSGSPLSAALVFRQLQQGKDLCLADCFRLELNLSLRAAQYGEFAEGVRALLVDKDKKPKWKNLEIEDIEPEVIDWFFKPVFTIEEHPLKSLGF